MAEWNPRANEIFAIATELPERQRQVYLAQACGDDAELRRAVDEMLAAHEQAGDFLDRPAAGVPVVEATVRPDSGPPLPADGGVVRALAGSDTPAEQQQQQRPRGECEAETLPVAPVPDAVGLPERYAMKGEIARGGMGAVLKGHDVELGRDVAVKVLLETHKGRTELVQRFVEEAKIAGQLQHPGIVPVYEVGGRQEGKRPYFTMKLVKGKTLASLLKARQNPGDELPRFIGVFEQVCQTLAYAHDRGVIHRDLKPANVMVGAFGEVQVMDWGLAKVLAKGGAVAAAEGEEPASVIQAGDSEGGQTRAGTVMGTPAYLAPEQARGEVDRLDERADVFGLGAILCEILTGKPPFTGASAEALRRARDGDLAGALARLDGCGADADLVALAKRCLAAEPAGRPANADAVAQAVTAYQRSVVERLRLAEMQRAQAQVKAAEERKRRKLTMALAASVLLTILLGGGGWAWTAEQKARQQREAAQKHERLRQEVAGLLDEAARLRAQPGRAAEARGQVQRALARLDDFPDESLRQRAEGMLAEMDSDERDRRLLVRLDEASLAAADTDVDANRFADERAVPVYRAALEEYGWKVGHDDVKVLAKQLAQKSAALRESVVAALLDWIRVVGYRLVEEPHLGWLKSMAAEADTSGWAIQVRRAADAPPDQRRAALEKMADEADVTTLPPSVLVRLARHLREVKAKASAVRLLRRARHQYPGDFWINHSLGEVLGYKGNEAVRCFTAAVALRPGSPGAHTNLGLALREQGETAEAIASHRKAIELDSKYFAAYFNLSGVLREKGELDEAIACLRKVIELAPNFAGGHTNLGLALVDKGLVDEAIAGLRKAIELAPSAGLHTALGAALARKGKVDEAIDCHRKAIELAPNFAGAHNNLGTALAAKGQKEDAIACFRKAITCEPTNALGHYNLGLSLYDKGKGQMDDAIASLRTAIELKPKSPDALVTLGLAQMVKEQLDDAIASFRKAIEWQPNYALAHLHLGGALMGKGQVDDAIASFRKATEWRPDDALAHGNLGRALIHKGQVDEGIASFRAAIKHDPQKSLYHWHLANALSDKGQTDDAITSYREAIKLDPKQPATHGALGNALLQQGKFADAEASTRTSLDLLSPKSPQRPLGLRQLRECQRMLELEKKLPEVLAGKVKPAADEQIDFVRVCMRTKRYLAAVQLAIQAMEADPKRADDLRNGLRFNAARCAALAAAGKGADAGKLTEKESGELRQKALGWLRLQLAVRQKQAQSEQPGEADKARAALTLWQKTPDLATVRDAEALKTLTAEERQACERLWADVAALLRQSEPKSK